MNMMLGIERRPSLLHRAGTTLAVLSLSISAAYAAPLFDKADDSFEGRVSASGVVLPGKDATIAGRGFKPGQEVTLSRSRTVLNPGGDAFAVDAEGNFEGTISVPADAVPGYHPIVVDVANPSAATVYELKVSPDVPLAGQDKYTATSQKLVQGLYQTAYSAKSDRLFVTSAVGRPPVKVSQLVKVNPKDLSIEASVTPAKVPGRDDDHLFAVYGVDVDDANGTVWVTNTRDGTVAVYKQSDLSLVKQFEPGLTPHSRDVAVDEKHGKAYVSTPGKNTIAVFDTAKLAFVKNIEIESSIKPRPGPGRGEPAKVSTMSLALDEAGGKLYTISGSTNEAIVIDTASDSVEKIVAVNGIRSASGVAVDAKGKRLFVAAQGSDSVSVVDLTKGEVVQTVLVGAGALNVGFDPVGGLAYVSNRGAGTVTVLSGDGKIVANLDGGTFPNHALADGKGNVYVVNKARGQDDAQGDRLTRLTPRK